MEGYMKKINKLTILTLLLTNTLANCTELLTDNLNCRIPEYKVLNLIINRHTSRAMSGEEISDQELMSLFEAAKWAPSSFNSQPWRFIYVKKDSPKWSETLNIIDPYNQIWAKNGSVLILAISYKYFNYNKKISNTHALDTGSATQNMLLQGHYMGLLVNAIAGFDYEKAKELFKINDDYEIHAMYVVGYPGDINTLPEKLQLKETKSNRKKINEFVFKDNFEQRI